ncbi:MAG: CBS domain-containing protein [Chitinophagales bacterium]|nr:CBS domain-containing protein [Chitinophagales bacterium]
MDRDTQVSHLMTKKVIVADLKTKFSNILTLFLDYHIYHLPVVFDDKLLGIISMTDALKYYRSGASEEDFQVEDIMTHNPKTLHANDTLAKAASILAEANFRTLPVVDDAGKIVGILSNKDLVRVLDKMLSTEE